MYTNQISVREVRISNKNKVLLHQKHLNLNLQTKKDTPKNK